VVAQPADIHPELAVPVVCYVLGKPEGYSGLRHSDGELRIHPGTRFQGGFCNTFRQVAAPVADSSISLPVDLEVDFVRSYCQLPSLPELSPWLGKVLNGLVEQGRLAPGDIRRDAQGRLLPEHHEKVAKALEAYLSTSGKYTYSLTLPRQDR